MMTVEAERPTAVGSPVSVGSLSSRCCTQPLSPGRENEPPASPVSSAGSSTSDTSIHVDPTEATLTVSVVHTSSRPPSSAAASPPPSPVSPLSVRRSPEPVSMHPEDPAPKDRPSPSSPAGSSPKEGRQLPAVAPVVLPTPVKLTNFSIDAILKPSFGSVSAPQKKECKTRPLDVVNLIKGSNKGHSTTKHNSHSSPHGIDHIVHGHKYLMQRNNSHQQQQPQHLPTQHPHFVSRGLHHSHRSSFSPYHPQSHHPTHTSHHHQHPRSPTTTPPTIPGRFIYPSPASRDSSSPPTNSTKSSRHHPYPHHHHHHHNNSHHHHNNHHHHHHHHQQSQHSLTETATATTTTAPGSRSPGVNSSSSSSTSSTGPTSPGGCSSVSVTSSSGGSPTYKSSSRASPNNSDAHSLHSPGAHPPPPAGVAPARSASPRSEHAEGKDPMIWPAWVYCTRYSDRPSSGPRARKLKKCKDKKVEEKRPRTAFTNEQLGRLKKEFDENRYLTEVRRQDLAKELGLNESQIKIWFQNKRAKMKKASGVRNGLAIQLMAQGLYNHSTVSNEESDDQSISGGMN